MSKEEDHARALARLELAEVVLRTITALKAGRKPDPWSILDQIEDKMSLVMKTEKMFLDDEAREAHDGP
jgi:hypothetical protein